jgi:SAM-dependent methyltransferase
MSRFRKTSDPDPVAAVPAPTSPTLATPSSGPLLHGAGDDGAAFSWWPAFPPEGYLNQLTDASQQWMAAKRADLRLEDCRFYHTVDLPTGETVAGPWDLRGAESDYLGHVDLGGKRVLELGPSSGHLTYWMEKQGADVVAFDVGWDVSLDVQHAPGGEMRQLREDHGKMISDFQNSWWYLHKAYDSKAKVAYGDIYDLPRDLGTFDVATFGAILLHLRSPIGALEQAALRTEEAIIVTDTWPESRETMMDNIMRIFPNGETGRWLLWWLISPGAVIEMLKILGFGDITFTEHTQRHQHGHRDVPFVDQPMYTIVGRRS